MAKSFLGKQSPTSKAQPKGSAVPLWLLILAPLAVAAAVLSLLFSDFGQSIRVEPTPSPISQNIPNQRDLASIKLAAGTTGADAGAAAGAATGANAAGSASGTKAADKKTTTAATTVNCPTTEAAVAALNPEKIFPIVPDGLIKDCPSPNWNLMVVRFFIYKALTAINWLAGALAIIFTIIAGLYYISGFASEANVKKAKTILTATYVGLIIVIMARLIIYGSIQIFTDKEYNPGQPLPHSTDFVN